MADDGDRELVEIDVLLAEAGELAYAQPRPAEDFRGVGAPHRVRARGAAESTRRLGQDGTDLKRGDAFVVHDVGLRPLATLASRGLAGADLGDGDGLSSYTARRRRSPNGATFQPATGRRSAAPHSAVDSITGPTLVTR